MSGGPNHLDVEDLSMPGCAFGFAVGNERIVAALARVKSYLATRFHADSGCRRPRPDGPDDCIREMRDTYRRRRDVLVKALPGRLDIPPPRASMLRGRLCQSHSDPRHRRISTLLIEKAEIAVSPGTGCEHGECFVRIALVENEQRIRRTARSLRPLP